MIKSLEQPRKDKSWGQFLTSREKKELKRISENNLDKSVKKNTEYIPKQDRGPVEIYAELTKKQFNGLCTGELIMRLPSGSTVKHKPGKRRMTIMCSDKDLAKIVEDGLDTSGIIWQEM